MLTTRLRLEAYIHKYLELWDFYGVIRVIQQGEVLFERACGYASIEFDIKNSMSSRFSLASLSKQFTAFAIMLLYDQRLLDIDKAAQLYLPADMKLDESITVHHLLSHTSGLYQFHNFENDFFAEYNRQDYSRSDYFERYINKKPTSTPGSAYDYNNSNYNVLAWIIENVSGERYDDYIRKHIFLPLNMTNSEVDDGCKPITNRSCPYVKDCDATVKGPYHNEKFSIGAGAIISNCDDLYKWHICLRDRTMLSQSTYTRFFKENLSSYCYGLEHQHNYEADSYSHGGDHLGVSTYMCNDFDEDSCIIILSNNEAFNQYRLGNAISAILHEVHVDAPSKHVELPITVNKLQEYCGTYLKDKIQVEMMNGKLYFTRFSGNLHIEIYPVGEGRFVRRYSDQIHPYSISENEDGQMSFFGYIKD